MWYYKCDIQKSWRNIDDSVYDIRITCLLFAKQIKLYCALPHTLFQHFSK